MPDDRLPPGLEDAVDRLREMPQVRPEWIAGVVERAGRQRAAAAGAGPARRWSLHPITAIAAGLVCAAVGAGGTYLILARGDAGARRDSTPSLLASSAAAAAASATPVRFTIVAPGATSVQLVGDFNEWNPNALPMRRTSDGSTWEVEIGLSPGRYTYAFVVDGRLARDPAAAQEASDDFGAPSSVLLVKDGGT